MVFNIHRGPLADQALRLKLLQSVDVAGLVRRDLGRLAIPAHGLLPPGLLGYERGAAPSPAARLRLAQEVELRGMVNPAYQGAYSALAEHLLDHLRECGCRIQTMTEMRFENFRASAPAVADFDITRWIGDYPDSDTFLHSLLHSREGLLGGFCGLPEMDRLVEQGRSETDPAVRHDLYQRIEKLIAARGLLLPLFHEQAYRFARPELEGYEVSFSQVLVAYEKLWLRQ
jgi:ABC-type oligopeptide transport system substrate-binding subunit